MCEQRTWTLPRYYERKMAISAGRYPVEKARGRNATHGTIARGHMEKTSNFEELMRVMKRLRAPEELSVGSRTDAQFA